MPANSTLKRDLAKPGRTWFGLLFMSFFQTAEQIVDPVNAHRKAILIAAGVVCAICLLFWPFALARRLQDIGVRSMWTWPIIGGTVLAGCLVQHFADSAALGVFVGFVLYLPMVLVRGGFLNTMANSENPPALLR